jgi:hypothetical protein
MRCSHSCAPRERTWLKIQRTWRVSVDSAGLSIPRAIESSCGSPPDRVFTQRFEDLADPLRQLDDDPLRAAYVAEPIAVFVALHLANELRAAGSQAGDDGVDIVDSE